MINARPNLPRESMPWVRELEKALGDAESQISLLKSSSIASRAATNGLPPDPAPLVVSDSRISPDVPPNEFAPGIRIDLAETEYVTWPDSNASGGGIVETVRTANAEWVVQNYVTPMGRWMRLSDSETTWGLWMWAGGVGYDWQAVTLQTGWEIVPSSSGVYVRYHYGHGTYEFKGSVRRTGGTNLAANTAYGWGALPAGMPVPNRTLIAPAAFGTSHGAGRMWIETSGSLNCSAPSTASYLDLSGAPPVYWE